MAPLLLYVPDAIGAGAIDMKTVAGLTMVQSLFATGSGAIVHRRFQFISRPLVLWMGAGATAASGRRPLFTKPFVRVPRGHLCIARNDCGSPDADTAF